VNKTLKIRADFTPITRSMRGVITQVELAGANVHEGEVAYDLTKGIWGLLLRDRYY